MQPFTTINSHVAPLDRANVDTDQIIPKQYLRSISRTGFGDYLFDEWRYQDHGELGIDPSTRPQNPTFVLNQPQYHGAQILLARENFGCGSSREHAVWALAEHGFRAIIAPTYGDIFANNAIKNGVLPITLPHSAIDHLFTRATQPQPLHLSIDLQTQTITDADDNSAQHQFEIDQETKHRLLNGLDDIGITLQHADQIRAYETQRRQQEPWLYT